MTETIILRAGVWIFDHPGFEFVSIFVLGIRIFLLINPLIAPISGVQQKI